MGLLKLSDPALSTTAEGLVARIEKLERNIRSGTMPTATLTTASNILNKSVEKENVEVSASEDDISDAHLTPASPFDRWADVMNELHDLNKALYGSLINSSAYIVGSDLLLIDAGSELFAKMVRDDKYARDSLRQAALNVTGLTFRLGPYDDGEYKVEEKSDTLNKIIESAQDLGLNIEIKE